MADEKNKLIDQSITQVDNYYIRGDDFPVTGKGSDLIPAGKEHGFAQGHNELVEAPCGNRNLEDSGDQTPSVWGKGGTTWTVETNHGESNSSADSPSFGNSVNFVTGKMDGYEERVSPIGNVADMNVHIPEGKGKPSPGVKTKGVGSASVGVENA